MTNTLQLQGIGKVNGTPAKEIKVGNVLMWNYGGLEEVVKLVLSKTGKTLMVTLKSADNSTYDRKLGADKLVCVKY